VRFRLDSDVAEVYERRQGGRCIGSRIEAPALGMAFKLREGPLLIRHIESSRDGAGIVVGFFDGRRRLYDRWDAA
jgi:hypothetical protein